MSPLLLNRGHQVASYSFSILIDMTSEVELMSSLAFDSAARDFTAVSGFMDKSDVEEFRNELPLTEVEGCGGS